MGKLLDHIAQPRDVQLLSLQELGQLAQDCRDRIVEVTSKRGGHLASSLGAIELTVALFKVFNLEQDRLLWDVGHQAYAYKLLTGRNERFETLAQQGGIKKFLSRDESPYDHFGAGHASTSISAGVGMVVGRDLQEQSHQVIAVIGDGAMTGGLAFEALNHNGFLDKRMLVIYSDNGMSIDPNVGALSKFITRISISKPYNIIREEALEMATKVPFSKTVHSGLQRIHDSVKSFWSPGMLFEQLGWRYFGPVDGHNLKDLVDLLEHVKELEGPIVVHALTQKGKGYKPAEGDAFKYHGVKPFVPESGEFIIKKPGLVKEVSYSKVFADKLGELMEQDPKVVVSSAAMVSGTGILDLQTKFPERVLDVGIAEGHAVTSAAGMATTGIKPFVAIYSTFLQRALDHIIHDVAVQRLPVRFMLDRAGLVGADGPTHHGAYDLTYLRMIPEMVVMVPKDGAELRRMVEFAHRHEDGPSAVRYPRGNTASLDESSVPPIELGKAHLLQPGRDVVLLAVGTMVAVAEEIAEPLKDTGFSVAVVNGRFVKPLDAELITALASTAHLLVTLEENTVHGGFGSGVLEVLSEAGVTVPTQVFGILDRFIAQGSPDQQREEAGLSAEQVLAKIRERLFALHASPRRGRTKQRMPA